MPTITVRSQGNLFEPFDVELEAWELELLERHCAEHAITLEEWVWAALESYISSDPIIAQTRSVQ